MGLLIKNNQRMTVLEQRFLEQVPILLHLIAKELETINETLKEIKENGTDLQRDNNR